MEIMFQKDGDRSAYTYGNKMNWRQRVSYVLADDATALAAGDLALKAWKGLGCLDAGRVDIRLDARGVPCFMEVNPLPGLDPDCSDLPILHGLSGGRYEDLIRSIMDSAVLRADKGL
jgi:D-alanine-D-alanine ligase